MKSVIFYGPGKFVVEDSPIPRVKKGEVLLKVVSCGLCGTDIKIFTHGHHAVKPPIIIGHEIVGTVIESAGNNIDIKVGENVIVVTPVGCMKCWYCWQGMQNMCPWVANDVHSIGYYTDGGFAEYILIPREAVEQRVLIKIPNTNIPLEHFALCEPLSCVINGQEKLKIKPEDTVVVIGAGPIGCLHVMLARVQGVRKIILADLDKKRLQLAKYMPADIFVHSAERNLIEVVLRETGQVGADVVIVAAPSGRAQEDAVQMAAIQGRISFFGGLPKSNSNISLASNLVHYKELEIYGAFASSRRQYVKALSLLLNRQVDTDKLISHTLPLHEIRNAVEIAKRGEALKIIIVP